MTCFHPQYIYINKSQTIDEIYLKATKEEKQIIRENLSFYSQKPNFKPQRGQWQLQIPCGNCLGCRLDHANDWATRLYCERKYHKDACFITLTYNNPNLPYTEKGTPTLRKKDVQDFFKRLIKKTKIKGLKRFYCGEYGPKEGRPHYHACIFGYIPKDLEVYKVNHRGDILYKSKEIQKIWGKGFVTIGEMNYETACYTARYVQKKAGIAPKITTWTITTNEFGELKKHKLKPHEKREEEFIEMSRRPGIGYQYWEDNKEIIKKQNGIMVKTKDGTKMKRLTRYYKKLWEKENYEELEKYKTQWIKDGKQKIQEMLDKFNMTNMTDDQKIMHILKQQEETLKIKAKTLKRNNII